MQRDCEVCKRHWEGHVFCKHLRGKFYRIMTGDFFHQLSLPEEIMNKYEGKISKRVYLKTPFGIAWDVSIRKVQGETFLDSGWKDFAEAHNIEMNDLLLFEFKETNSCFQVSIFGRNGIEKASSYAVDLLPAKHPRGVSDKSSTEESSYQSSEAPSDDSGSSRSTRDHTKRSRHEGLSSHHENFDTKRRNFDRNDSTLRNIKQESTGNQENDKPVEEKYFVSARKQHFTEAEKAKVHSMIQPAVQEGNPFFVAAIKPSYLYRTYLLPVPRSFAVDQLPHQAQTVVLRTPGCREVWLSTYFVYMKTSSFKINWRKFAIDKKLKVGDICVFELMKGNTILTLKVRISRK